MSSVFKIQLFFGPQFSIVEDGLEDEMEIDEDIKSAEVTYLEEMQTSPRKSWVTTEPGRS